MNRACDGIPVKCLDGSPPRLADCPRLATGTPGANERLLAARPARPVVA